MHRLAITQGQKIVETTVSLLSKRTIESMDSLAVIHGHKIVGTTVTFLSKKTIESMDRWL